MIYPTVEGILHPDGKLTLSGQQFPTHSVRVLVTILENSDETEDVDLGDYLAQLSDYEDRLARGEVQWQ